MLPFKFDGETDVERERAPRTDFREQQASYLLNG